MSDQAPRNRPTDLNRLAASIVASVTGEGEGIKKEGYANPGMSSGKNPAAVALGKLGGLKGGKARAEKLSSEERSEIAKKAAQTRWKKENPS